MNSRLQALVDRGYSKEEVLRLACFTEEELNYAGQRAFEHLSRNCSKSDSPVIIYIGGQPGSGKTILSMELKNSMPNFIEIGIDNYRMYHPRYLEIEKCIRTHWEGRVENINDTPGNDIADFTHFFAGAMTDLLTDMATELDENGKSYSVLMEWGMREPTGPLKSMKSLKEKGYKNIVLFVGVSKQLSYSACNLRADIMKNTRHIFRKVPKSFHDLCVDTLPDSIQKIYDDGYKKSIIDYMAIVSRNCKVLWDNTFVENPSDVYNSCLQENAIKTYNDLYKAFKGNKRELLGLNDDIEKLKELKEKIIVITPKFQLNSRTNIK